jgi:hypothetical protein
MKYNWKKIKIEYETTSINLRELSDKFKIPYITIRTKASKEKWSKQDNIITKIETKVTEKLIEKVAEKAAEQKEAEVYNMWENRNYARKQLILKLQNWVTGQEKATNAQIKSADMLAKYAGLYSEDNAQKNPFAGLSQEEINQRVKDRLKDINIII